MPQPEAQTAANGKSVNGVVGLEARLCHLFGEQRRLRELLDRTLAEAALFPLQEVGEKHLSELVRQTREELDRVSAELFRFQDEYCTDAARQEEYDSAIERILGFDPRMDLNEIEEILAGKRNCDMEEFIEELERTVKATPSQGGQ